MFCNWINHLKLFLFVTFKEYIPINFDFCFCSNCMSICEDLILSYLNKVHLTAILSDTSRLERKKSFRLKKKKPVCEFFPGSSLKSLTRLSFPSSKLEFLFLFSFSTFFLLSVLGFHYK